MRRHVFGAVMGLVVVTATALVGPAMASDARQVSVGDMVPALDRPQGVADRMLASVDLTALGDISPQSVRALDSSGPARYWVGRNRSSHICLILHIPGGNEVSASTCAEVTDFYDRGLGLMAGDGGSISGPAVEAYLLPSGIQAAHIQRNQKPDRASSEREAYFTAGTVGELQLKPSVVKRDTGRDFHFTPLTEFDGDSQ